MKPIETERLILSELKPTDAEFILKLLNEPAFIENIGNKGIETVQQAKIYLRNGPIKSYKLRGYGLYRVTLKENKIPIGICGLKKRDSLDIPDLGYALLQQYWSCGYATEAARAVLNYAAHELGFKKIAAITAVNNKASERVLEKNGFLFQKVVFLPEFESSNKLYIRNI